MISDLTHHQNCIKWQVQSIQEWSSVKLRTHES